MASEPESVYVCAIGTLSFEHPGCDQDAEGTRSRRRRRWGIWRGDWLANPRSCLRFLA
jgi:hypothetical protein